MARRGGLGKGLSALIPSELQGRDMSALMDVPLGEIVPNRHQPRQLFDEESLVSLTASVREVGVLQPVLVRPMDDGRYELIAGERRWRAAKRAGLQAVPALVRETDEVSSLEHALVENLHRDDLNPLEEAAAYQQLIEDFHLKHDEVARRVGRSRASVSNTLRLFQLPPSVQRLVGEGRLTAGHARALLGTPDRAHQERLARQAVDQGLSVRDVEEAIRDREEGDDDGPPRAGGGAAPSSRRRKQRLPGLLELEQLLSDRLDTRVTVTMTAKRGKVVIEFAGLEDLERIYHIMSERWPES